MKEFLDVRIPVCQNLRSHGGARGGQSNSMEEQYRETTI